MTTTTPVTTDVATLADWVKSAQFNDPEFPKIVERLEAIAETGPQAPGDAAFAQHYAIQPRGNRESYPHAVYVACALCRRPPTRPSLPRLCDQTKPHQGAGPPAGRSLKEVKSKGKEDSLLLTT
ncbi:hypothetical protein MTP99_007640 [Tenebrio molitor]|nr:hypothetical protein MTP99_007640 [Tenebrio molitor]